MANDVKYARVVWGAGDVRTKFPGLTEDQAKKLLARNESKIQDAMVEAGWDAIEQLGLADGHVLAEEEGAEDQTPEPVIPAGHELVTVDATQRRYYTTLIEVVVPVDAADEVIKEAARAEVAKLKEEQWSCTDADTVQLDIN